MLTLEELAAMKAAKQLMMGRLNDDGSFGFTGGNPSNIAYLAEKLCPDLSRTVATAIVSKLRSLGYLTNDVNKSGLVITTAGYGAIARTQTVIRKLTT